MADHLAGCEGSRAELPARRCDLEMNEEKDIESTVEKAVLRGLGLRLKGESIWSGESRGEEESRRDDEEEKSMQMEGWDQEWGFGIGEVLLRLSLDKGGIDADRIGGAGAASTMMR